MLEPGLKPEQVRSQDSGFTNGTPLGLSSEMRIEIPHFSDPLICSKNQFNLIQSGHN